ncbi:MAG TPA: von Willebrand factor type A domain-containing protein [Pirellulaceae bacterium]|jgi:secreted protein with Ig-like and vWFA domain
MNTDNQNTNANKQDLNGDGHTPEELAAAELTAYALDQLTADERAALERRSAEQRVDLDHSEAAEIRNLADALTTARNADPLSERSAALRERLQQQLAQTTTAQLVKPRLSSRRWLVAGLAIAASLLIAVVLYPLVSSSPRASKLTLHINQIGADSLPTAGYGTTALPPLPADAYPATASARGDFDRFEGLITEQQYPMPPAPVTNQTAQAGQATNKIYQSMKSINDKMPSGSLEAGQGERYARRVVDESGQPLPAATAEQQRLNEPLTNQSNYGAEQRIPNPPPGGSVVRGYGGGIPGGGEGGAGGYGGSVASSSSASVRKKKDIERVPGGTPVGGMGWRPESGGTSEIRLKDENKVPAAEAGLITVIEAQAARAQAQNQAEVEVADASIQVGTSERGFAEQIGGQKQQALSELRKDRFDFVEANKQASTANKRVIIKHAEQGQNTEQYAPIYENQFLSPLNQPLSTFSIDVDTASYANTRRFLTSNRLPPRNAVRIEELVNYFRYDYPQPKDGQPFSVNMEVAECPWREGHLVLRVGLKGKDIDRTKRPASNLVFLLDVSGSMSDENKLPLLKTAMKLLVNELGENDRVSIVTYAGDAGLKLPSARGHEQKKINAVIDSLSAGGSTNGSAGIELAYEQATNHFIKEGTNRVILCTDGDLNVGITSDEALVKLIKDKAKTGVFLTVLGFGEGNLKDAKMERLADNGNGLYAYIDSVREAKKVLVEQLTGSTITIAKDVKIQIEFNPAQIAAYRLLGYENRVLAAQDFNNDKKDAGEIGAGHTVTALYELVPVGATEKQEPQQQPGTDPLKYQDESSKFKVQGSKSERGSATLNSEPGTLNSAASADLLTLKLRYKAPGADSSQLLEFPLQDRGGSFNSASSDFQFAASVASFGMVLRQSQYRGTSNLAAVEEIASGSLGTDIGGYRAEFIDLVRKAQALGTK